MYGLITTRTGLRLPLQSSFFHESKVVIKCTSTISPGFWGGTTTSSSINRGSSILIHGPGSERGGRKESLAQATRHHSVIDSREDTFIGESIDAAVVVLLIGNRRLLHTVTASVTILLLLSRISVHSRSSCRWRSSSSSFSLIYTVLLLFISSSCPWPRLLLS